MDKLVYYKYFMNEHITQEDIRIIEDVFMEVIDDNLIYKVDAIDATTSGDGLFYKMYETRKDIRFRIFFGIRYGGACDIKFSSEVINKVIEESKIASARLERVGFDIKQEFGRLETRKDPMFIDTIISFRKF